MKRQAKKTMHRVQRLATRYATERPGPSRQPALCARGKDAVSPPQHAKIAGGGSVGHYRSRIMMDNIAGRKRRGAEHRLRRTQKIASRVDVFLA